MGVCPCGRWRQDRSSPAGPARLGQLEHSTGFPHDWRGAGDHLITPPLWNRNAVLPTPIGNQAEPGPLWVTEPALCLLLRLSGPRCGLCEAPEIRGPGAWADGSSGGAGGP